MVLEGAIGYGKEVVSVNLTWEMAVGVIVLGFVGGTLSGFLGSGGAFIMTPGMMNLGIPGILAVGSNITHKFGKAMIGSRAHGELGHVDKKLAISMAPALLAGVKLAVYIQEKIFEIFGKAGSNLYISLVFIIILSALVAFMIRDLRKKEREGGRDKLPRFIDRLPKIPPVVFYKVSNIRTSIWYPLFIAFLTGFLAGTIGVGGFFGVPAMIYLLGLTTRMAAGTELFLAIFSGAFGAFSYALAGFVDLRIVMLLYLGSLIGVQLGAIATEILSQRKAKIILMFVILAAIISRAIAIPMYLKNLGYITISESTVYILKDLSFIILFGTAILAVMTILKSIVTYSRKSEALVESSI